MVRVSRGQLSKKFTYRVSVTAGWSFWLSSVTVSTQELNRGLDGGIKKDIQLRNSAGQLETVEMETGNGKCKMEMVKSSYKHTLE